MIRCWYASTAHDKKITEINMLLLRLVVATLLRVISKVISGNYFGAFIICVGVTLRCSIIITDKVDGKHDQIRR